MKPEYSNFRLAARIAMQEKRCLCLDSKGIFLVSASNESDIGGQAYCWSIDLGKKEIETTVEAFNAICVLGGF